MVTMSKSVEPKTIEEERAAFRSHAREEGLEYSVPNHGDRLREIDPEFRALADLYEETGRKIEILVGLRTDAESGGPPPPPPK